MFPIHSRLSIFVSRLFFFARVLGALHPPVLIVFDPGTGSITYRQIAPPGQRRDHDPIELARRPDERLVEVGQVRLRPARRRVQAPEQCVRLDLAGDAARARGAGCIVPGYPAWYYTAAESRYWGETCSLVSYL